MNGEAAAYFNWQIDRFSWSGLHDYGGCDMCTADWHKLNPDRLPDDPSADDDERLEPHLDEQVSVELEEEDDED